jgi:hypothetical protein
MEDFETKLAAAGEMFEKLAAEQGLDINDFSDDEAADILTQIMDGGSAPEAPAAEPKVASAAAPVAQPAQQSQGELLYAQAFQEVTKQAAAEGIDVTQVAPEELHNAVLKQAHLMSDPAYQAKVAALNEKIAEADMLGRVMAHSYVNELAKIAESNAAPEGKGERDEDKDKKEKKASLVAALRSKQAGEVPPAFASKGKDEDEKEKEKKEKEEAEKKASFVSARVHAHLLSQGIDPSTGQKLASAEQNEIDQAAIAILKEKGWV